MTHNVDTSRRSWPEIVEHAKAIMLSYDTGVTLRQLFYRLVADHTLPNTRSAYSQLSDTTASARREGRFPDFIDQGREIHEYRSWSGPDDARSWLAGVYRRDRTHAQDWAVYLGVEKRGIVEQLKAWFGDLGVPILALGGYTSQTYVKDVRKHAGAQGDRPAVLLYAGDFDASGEDIDRDFLKRTGCWDKVIRVALSVDQVREYSLPVAPGKPGDSRAAGFIAKHGDLMQVEVDALPPDTLRALFGAALAPYWDDATYRDVLRLEDKERARLAPVDDEADDED